jgi:hypothetical protein
MTDDVNQQIKAILSSPFGPEKFTDWLKIGGLTTAKYEAKWFALRELYDFCVWVTGHSAWIKGVSPVDIVAVDGPDERRFRPEGGLGIDYWPYLKALFDTEDDLAEVSRDEIVTAILKNELRKRGRSIAAATYVVHEMADKIAGDGTSNVCMAIEQFGFQKAVEDLEARARDVAEELDKHQKDLQAGLLVLQAGPVPPTMFFLGKQLYLLAPQQFQLLKALWRDRSLPLEDVVGKLWGQRPASATEVHVNRVRRLASPLGRLLPITISVTKDPNQIGNHWRVSLELLSR